MCKKIAPHQSWTRLLDAASKVDKKANLHENWNMQTLF